MKKRVLFAKTNFLMFKKLDRRKYLQKLMLKYLNSKAELREN